MLCVERCSGLVVYGALGDRSIGSCLATLFGQRQLGAEQKARGKVPAIDERRVRGL